MFPNLLGPYTLLVRKRLNKIFPWPWFTAASILIASRGLPPLLPAIITIVSMFAIATCVYIYNDVIDLEMDKLNTEKLDRPLPSGKVSIKKAKSVVILGGFIGTGLSLLVNLKTFLLCVAYLTLFWAYSYPRIRLKKRFLLKEGTLAMGGILSSLIGGMAVGSVSAAVTFWGIFLFVTPFVVLPTFADFQDIKEDKEYGIKSLAMVWSWKTKIEIIILYILVVMIITPVSYMQLGLNIIFPIVVVASCLLFLRFIFPLLSRYEYKPWSRAYKAVHGFWILMQVALILGSLNIPFLV